MHKFDEMYETLPANGLSLTQSQGQSQSQSQSKPPSVPGDGVVRPHYESYARWLSRQSDEAMRLRRDEAEMIFRRVGITFAVYGDKEAFTNLAQACSHYG